MRTCMYCDEPAHSCLDVCKDCLMVLERLPKFVAKEIGFKEATLILFKAQEERTKKMVAEKSAAREAKVVAAMAEFKTLAELRVVLAAKKNILGQMVGTLYPAILEAEIDILEEAYSRIVRSPNTPIGASDVPEEPRTADGPRS